MASFALRTLGGAMRHRRWHSSGSGMREHGVIQFASHFQPEDHRLDQIDLIVADMAGTTVDEGGIVYRTLHQVMNEEGIRVSERAIDAWHGAKKEEAIAHFAAGTGIHGDDLGRYVRHINARFEQRLEEAYFGPNTPVRPITSGLLDWLSQLRARGTRVALDTGYPPALQSGLAELLGMGLGVVDAHVSAYEVAAGRPYPYMIFRAMETCGVPDVRRVAKVGDSARDMAMGRNAGCGLVVGVLSGADSAATLFNAGADIVVPVITDLDFLEEESEVVSAAASI